MNGYFPHSLWYVKILQLISGLSNEYAQGHQLLPVNPDQLRLRQHVTFHRLLHRDHPDAILQIKHGIQGKQAEPVVVAHQGAGTKIANFPDVVFALLAAVIEMPHRGDSLLERTRFRGDVEI